ncbi:hypothetical protein [Streptomyces sp. NPDC090112]|uniref:hypothetical protein n=1 Tax=Streptomyces sp. NPDC090112 TaxID=3365949 RepID=UPI0038147DB8
MSHLHPEAVALSVSIQAGTTGMYPVVQRLAATGSSPVDEAALPSDPLFGHTEPD